MNRIVSYIEFRHLTQDLWALPVAGIKWHSSEHGFLRKIELDLSKFPELMEYTAIERAGIFSKLLEALKKIAEKVEETGETTFIIELAGEPLEICLAGSGEARTERAR